MKQQSSSTAEGAALVRAIEASRPEDRRICYDPLARSLVSGFSYTMSKEELKRRYFSGSNARRVIAKAAAIASAQVR
jgi:O-methyltransferase involved in polyketide biosynthesis